MHICNGVRFVNIKNFLFLFLILFIFLFLSSVSANEDVTMLMSSQNNDVCLNDDYDHEKLFLSKNSNESNVSSINFNPIKSTSNSIKQSSNFKKIKPSIKVPKNKIFKTKTKIKKYSITLKANKNIIKNVKVSLTIKGNNYYKIFKISTNKKGKAIFSIVKLTKKGKYDAVITFKGNKNYYKVSKKLKISISRNKCKIKVMSGDIVYSNENSRITINDEFIDVSDAFKYLNVFRTEKGVWYWNKNDKTKTYFNTNSNNQLKPLVWDSDLEKTAKIRAKEIATLFSHTRPDGSDCWEVYPDNLLTYGENIALGQESCREVIEVWKETNYHYNDQGHRRNMLDSNFNRVGIAGFKLNGVIYWVQSFGLKK